jgi:hypothetical protein
MRTIAACLTIAVASVNLECQAIRPTLEPRLFKKVSVRELMDLSTDILVGKIDSAESVGTPLRIENHIKSLQLKRIAVSPELYVKGSATRSQIMFYRYDCAADCSGIENLSWLPEGSRRLLFLTKDGSQLRATADVLSAALPVMTGNKTGSTVNEDKRKAIAQILLQPEPGMDSDSFASNLFSARAVARELVGRADTIELVKPLLSYPSRTVQIESCLILAEAMYDYNGCLHRFASDPTVSTESRRRIERRIEGLAENLRQLRVAFKSNPMQWVRATASSNTQADITDLLKLLARHSDAAVRRRACDILRRHYASVSEATCEQRH